jgi:CO dehydrogenase nickel-insertion accessory protein CooC1
MSRAETNPEKLTLAGNRIGIFGKGGSGKSTVVVLLATVLRSRGYDVCILDADSTNLGLPLILGIDQPPAPLMEYFGGMVFSGGLVTCPVDDPTRLPGSEISLEELPPKYQRQSPLGVTLLIAGKIGDQGPGAGCDGPISKIARDLRVFQRGRAPVTLVDFKAGFEDMAESMRDIVDQIKNGKLPATQHIDDPMLVDIANQLFTQASIKGTLCVLNKILDKKTEIYLKRKLAEKGIHPDGVIYEYPAISLSWLKGTLLDATEARDDVIQIIEELKAAESAYSTLVSKLAPRELQNG